MIFTSTPPLTKGVWLRQTTACCVTCGIRFRETDQLGLITVWCEIQNDVSMFERVNRADHHTTSVDLAVKKFARTRDDTQAEQLRTPKGLQKSMDHLCNILDTTDFTFGQVPPGGSGV